MNQVILIGRVGKDPDVKYLDGGNCVANFSMATSEFYKNKAGERVESTEWHRVVIWGKLAEIIEKYVHKGDKLMIQGKIKTRSYENKSGDKVYTTEVYGENMEMLGDKREKKEEPAQSTAAQDYEYKFNPPASKPKAAVPAGPENDDLPF